MDETTKLFVYGTLRPELGTKPNNIATFIAQEMATVHGPATLVGYTMYNLGWYPGLLPSDNDGDAVVGTVIEIPTRFLPYFDSYEGYNPQKPSESLYMREMDSVRMDKTGAIVRVQLYVYNDVPDDYKACVIETGDWRDHKVFKPQAQIDQAKYKVVAKRLGMTVDELEELLEQFPDSRTEILDLWPEAETAEVVVA